MLPLGDGDHGVLADGELLEVDGDVEIAKVVWHFVKIVLEAVDIAVIRQLLRRHLECIRGRLVQEGPAASQGIDVSQGVEQDACGSAGAAGVFSDEFRHVTELS